MATRLNTDTIELIKTDPELYKQVTIALGVKPSSLEPLLRRNGRRFTEYPILKVIADFSGKQPNELTEEYDDETEQLAETNT